MKLQTIFASLFIGVAIAADANSVAAKINVLNSNTQQLDRDIQGYLVGGLTGIPTALKIQVDTINSYLATNDIISEANASGAFGESGSTTVINAVKTLSSTVVSTLKDLEGKVGTFADLSPLALAGLYQLRQASSSFAISLASKLASDQVGTGLNYYIAVDNAFKSAITTYGGKAT